MTNKINSKTEILFRGGIVKNIAKKITKTNLPFIYSPGVAEVVKAINENPSLASVYTNISRRILILTDGSAALGLGKVLPIASKPIMEAKSTIYKQIANIDAIDIEYNQESFNENNIKNTMKGIVSFVKNSFSAVHIEDMAAPHAFYVFNELISNKIKAMHDDRHATALAIMVELKTIIKRRNKDISNLKVAIFGAGPAGYGIYEILSNICEVFVFDSQGSIQNTTTEWKKKLYSKEIMKKSYDLSIVTECDVLIGLSKPNAIPSEVFLSLPENAIAFLLSNPSPDVNEKTIDKRKDITVRVGGFKGKYITINNASYYPDFMNEILESNFKDLEINKKIIIASERISEHVLKTSLNATGLYIYDLLV